MKRRTTSLNAADLLDPELKVPLEEFLAVTDGGVNLHDIPRMRAISIELFSALQAEAPAIEGVVSEDYRVAAADGSHEVAARIYRPMDGPKVFPALLWMHGGGYVLGNIDQDDLFAKQLAKDIQSVVVSVEYRLAPEHPFPLPLEDCYMILNWMAANCQQLQIDRSRIAIGGASAGGGLAAGLALMARDRADVDVAFQLLIYPMIDHRNVLPASDSRSDALIWSRESNLIGWRSYLGEATDAENVSEYAAALHATDLRGLPPAYIPVGALDLFLRENIEYAQRLIAAGVPAELHVYPGAYHAFDMFAPLASVSQRFNANRNEALKRALST
jgi:acetyl esterase/lipase